MAKYSNTIEYQLRTTADLSGINKLKSELTQVANLLSSKSNMTLFSNESAQKSIVNINKIKKAFDTAFNSKFNILDISKLNKELGSLSFDSMYKSLSNAGTIGRKTFADLVARTAKFETGLKNISSVTDKIFNTFGNTVRWGITASVFETVSNRLRDSVEYVKELDKSLNDIRIVSDYTAQDMRNFSLYANEAAKSLGQTTVAFTNASLIFAQQGYNLEDSNKFAELTLKVANTTGQTTAEVSEQITSWVNGYQLSLDQLESTLDKVTKVAAVGASDTQELMTAASKVASVASTLGVTTDQLISQMSTIISVTREAPENIGNSLKTIYARLGDLRMGETLEDGVDLGNLSGELQKVGVDVLDTSGAMRNMGDILEDLMSKWNTFDAGQKQALGIKLAGKYQYTRFMALMENADMYQDTMAESINSDGFLQKTQDIYMESLEAKMTALSASFEGLTSTLFDPDSIKPFIDALTQAVSLLTDFVDAIGGGGTALTAFGGIATNVFSKNIAGGITNMLSNMELKNLQNQNVQITNQMLNERGITNVTGEGSERTKELRDYVLNMTSKQRYMNEEERKGFNTNLDEWVAAIKEVEDAEEDLEQAVIATKAAYSELGVEIDLTFNRKTGELNFSEFAKLFGLDTESFKIDKKTLQSLNFGKLSGSAFEISEILSKTDRKSFNLGSKDYNSILIQLQKMGEVLGEDNPKIKEFVEKLNALAAATDKVDDKFDEITVDFNKLAKSADQFQKSVTDPSGIAAKSDRLNDANVVLGAKNTRGSSEVDDMEIKATITDLVSLVGTIGMFHSSISSLSNLFNVWNDSASSLSEKLGSTFENLLFSLPMLISSFIQVNDVVTKLQENNSIEALFKKQNLNAQRENNVVLAENTAIMEGNTVVAETNTVAAEQNTVATEQKTVATEQNTIATGQNTGAIQENTRAKKAESVSDVIDDMGDSSAFGKFGSKVSGALSKLKSSFGGIAINLFKGGLKLVTKAIPYAMVADIGINIVKGIYDSVTKAEDDARQERIDNINQQISDSLEKTDAFDNSNFLKLFNEYKETGKATDEFVNVLKSLSEQFGITNSDVLLATRSYKELGNEIQKAVEKEHLRQAELARQQIDEFNDKYKNTSSIDKMLRLFGSSDLDDVNNPYFPYKDIEALGKAAKNSTTSINDWKTSLQISKEEIDITISEGSLKSGVKGFVSRTLTNLPGATFTDKDAQDFSSFFTTAFTNDETKANFASVVETSLAESNAAETVLDLFFSPLASPELRVKAAAAISENPDLPVSMASIVNDVLCLGLSREQVEQLGKAYSDMVFGDESNLPTSLASIASIITGTEIKPEDLEDVVASYKSALASGDTGGAIATLVDGIIKVSGVEFKSDEIAKNIGTALVFSIGQSFNIPTDVLQETIEGDLAPVLAQFVSDVDKYGFEEGFNKLIDNLKEVTFKLPDGTEMSLGQALAENPELANSFVGMLIASLSSGNVVSFSTKNKKDIGDAISEKIVGAVEGVEVQKDGTTKVTLSITDDDGNLNYAGIVLNERPGYNSASLHQQSDEYNAWQSSYGRYLDLWGYDDSYIDKLVKAVMSYRFSDDTDMSLEDQAKEAAKYIAQGFISANGDFESARDTLVQLLGSEAVSLLMGEWDEHSPSKVAWEISHNIGLGYIEGLEDIEDEAQSTLERTLGWNGNIYDLIPDTIINGSISGTAEALSAIAEQYGFKDDLDKALSSDATASEKISSLIGVTGIVESDVLPELRKEAKRLEQEWIDQVERGNVNSNRYKEVENNYKRVSSLLEMLEQLIKNSDNLINEYSDLVEAMNSEISHTLLGHSSEFANVTTIEEYYTTIDNSLTQEQKDELVTMYGEGGAYKAIYGTIGNTIQDENVRRQAMYDAEYLDFNQNRGASIGGGRKHGDIISGQLLGLGLSEAQETEIGLKYFSAANNSDVAFDNIVTEWLLSQLKGQNLSSDMIYQILSNMSFDSDTFGSRENAAMAADNAYYQILTSTSLRDSRLEDVSGQASSGKSIVNDVANDTVQNKSFDGLINSGIAEFFEDATGKSDAFAESLGLLSDQSYQAQLGLIDIDSAVESLEHNIQLNSISELQDNLDKLEKQGNLGLDIDVDVDDSRLLDVEDEISQLKRTLLKEQFTLDIDVGGDLIDTANSMIEAMEDVSSAAELIGEGLVVAAKDADALAAAYPGILENAEIMADGTIVLNEEIAQSAKDTAMESIQASAQEQASKLTVYADYADTMAQNYALQAELYAQMSEGTVEDSEAAQRTIALLEDDTAKIKADYYSEESDAARQLAENEADYSFQAAEAESENFGQASNDVAAHFNSIGNSAYSTMSYVASAAYQAASGVSEVGSDNPKEYTIPPFEGGLSGSSTKTVEKKTVAAGEKITVNGTERTVGDSAQQVEWGQKAAEMQALSEAYRSAAQSARNKITSLLANAASTTSGIEGAGKGSGSGGGGGGSGSSYEPKQIELTEDELNRYEKVDTALDSISNELDKLATEQERLTGKDLIKNLEKQVELLNQQLDIQKEKLAIQKEELAEYDKRLAEEFGVTFADSGLVSNYAERFNYYLGYLNELERQYNAATTEEAQEALQEQIDAAKKALDDYKDLIDKRDELFSNSIRESEKAIQDYYDQIEDLMIDTFNRSVEAIDSIKELNDLMAELHHIGNGLRMDNPFRELSTMLEKLEKFNSSGYGVEAISGIISENLAKINSGLLDDDEIKALEKLNQIYQDAADSGATSIVDMYYQALQAIQNEVDMFESTGMSAIFGENSAALYEAAENILKLYIEARQAEEEAYEEIADKMVDIIDFQNEKIEKQRTLYENITAELEHQYNVIESTRGENAYDDLARILAARMENLKAMMDQRKEEIAYWQDMLKYTEKDSEAYDKLIELIQEAKEGLDELVEDSIELNKEMNQLATNKALDQWARSMLGGDDLEWAQEQWELINRNADQYLDAVNSAYETQKLQSAYMDLLDGSNNLAVQRMITEQMNEQLDYLRQKEKLSEYDVAYANAQLEILRKRIALEEAQANKSQMKLRRDSQGNYSYVYTADDNNIKSAQDDLLDAQNNAYNLTKDNIVNVQADMFSALSDAQQRILAIQEEVGLSQEEKAKRIKEIVDRTVEYINGLSEQLGESNKHIVDDYIGMVQLLGEENSAKLQDVYDEVVNGNDEALTQIDERFSTTYTESLENIDDIHDAFDQLYDDLLDINDSYFDQMEDMLERGGDAYDDFTDHIEDCLNATQDLVDGTREFFDILKDESGIMQKAQDTLGDYASQIADVNNKYNSQVAEADRLRDQLAKVQAENANLSNALQTANNGTNGMWTGGGANGGSGSGIRDANGNLDMSKAKAGTFIGFTGSYYYDSWGKNPSGNQYSGQAGAVYIDKMSSTQFGGTASNTGEYKVHISSNQIGDLGWIKPEQMFDTGGYVPADEFKNNEGRIAMLHKKELVLNADDTVNILAAVNSVRELAQSMKSGAFNSILSNLSGYNRMFDLAYFDDNASGLDQQITINAEFPNANDVSSIREAIISLPQLASQYANKQDAR